MTPTQGHTSPQTELAHVRRVAQLTRVIDGAFFVLYGLVGLEINLEMLGFRGGLRNAVDAVVLPALRPFASAVSGDGNAPPRTVTSYVMAFFSYAMLHVSLHGLLWLFAHGKRGGPAAAAPR